MSVMSVMSVMSGISAGADAAETDRCGCTAGQGPNRSSAR